jgi:hypothetical protein
MQGEDNMKLMDGVCLAYAGHLYVTNAAHRDQHMAH